MNFPLRRADKGCAIFALTLTALTLCSCNQSTQGGGQPAQVGAAPAAQTVPPPPVPPPVPQYHRTISEEQRWQQYMIARQAYDAQLAAARRQGRREQAATDQGQQYQAFDAGRQDQAAADQSAQSGAFNAGRHDQAATDRLNQGNAFNAGRVDQARVDQARIDQAHRDLDAAYRQAQSEPDPRRREQIVDHARAELAAATQGR